MGRGQSLLFKNIIPIGAAPIGTLFKLARYGEHIDPRYKKTYHCGLFSVDKIDGQTIGYFNEFLVEADLEQDFMETFIHA